MASSYKMDDDRLKSLRQKEADWLYYIDLLYEERISARRFQTGGSCTTEMHQQFDTCQTIPPTFSGNEYKGGSGDDGNHLTQTIHKLQPRGIQVRQTLF